MAENEPVNDGSTANASTISPGEGMKKIPSPGPGSMPAVDIQAVEEVESLEKRAEPIQMQLTANENRNKSRRSEEFKDNIHKLKVFSVWAGWLISLVLFLAVFVTWGLHLVLPPYLHWIQDTETLGTMRTILFTVGAALGGAIIQKFLD